jgi:mono/diheme cytochrome c family protein
VTGDKKRLIGILLKGLEGTIEVNGETYINAMAQHSFLNDQDAADVLTYIRSHFSNHASAVTAAEVVEIRSTLPAKK